MGLPQTGSIMEHKNDSFPDKFQKIKIKGWGKERRKDKDREILLLEV